ncbi:MAG: hypothetical protein HFI38_01535 [Lachnospiraceae bacterium]|nr:hypothetical protein [Lachnospiraceae bacterium]
MGLTEEFIQCDQILFEDREGWVIDRNENALYKIDLLNDICKLISILPTPLSITEEELPFYRINPHCYKKDKDLFCIPDRGDCIVVYDIKKKEISRIAIANPDSVRLGICYFWEYDEKLFAISYGLKKVLVVNIGERKVEEYVDIFDKADVLPGHEARRVNDSIFCISRNSNKIYEFDMDSMKSTVYEPAGLSEGLYAICYEDDRFWLSGISGKIYIWEKTNKKIVELDNYPEGFSIQRTVSDTGIPVFYKSFVAGDNICFLPINLDYNQLLCIDRRDDRMRLINLLEDGDRRRGMYTLEYIREDNVIGILFSENNYISEIHLDSNTFRKRFLKKQNRVAKLYRDMQMQAIIYENAPNALKIYERIVQSYSRGPLEVSHEYGKKIFKSDF